LDGGSAAGHGGRSSKDDVQKNAVGVVHELYARIVSVGEAGELRARVAGLFGGRMSDGEKAREGQVQLRA